MSISFAPQTFATSTQSADPFASDSEIQFNIFGSLNYEYCYNSGFLYAIVSSVTNTIPDQVIGQINDTNYTLTAPLFLPTGILNNKQFRGGIYYFKNIGSLAVGKYNTTFYVKKGDQTWASAPTIVEINATKYIQSGFVIDDLIRLDHYKYLFSLRLINTEAKCLSQAIVTINGTNYTMIRDEAFGSTTSELAIEGLVDIAITGQFFYIHEFPKVESTQEIEYNFTLVFEDQTKFVSGNTIKIYKEIELSQINLAGWDLQYLSDKYKATMNLRYFDGKNRPLEGLILSINGTNTTISHRPHGAEYMDTVVNGFKNPVYASYDFLDNPLGEKLEDIDLLLDYGKTYSVSVWFNNGSWNEKVIFSSATIPNKPQDITEPIIEYQNLESGMNGTDCWVSGKIKVYSSWPGFSLMASSFAVDATTGETWTSGVATQEDPSDTNYADGKFFKFNITLWSTPKDYWGNVMINYSFYYGNSTIGYGYEFNRYFGSTTIERVTPEKAGKYITPEKPLVYSVYTIEKSCCGTLTTKNQTEIYNMVAFEKAFRGDRIIYNKTYIFNSIVLNRNNINLTAVNDSKQLIITGGPSLYLGVPVISTDVFENLSNAVNGFPFESATKAKISKDFFTSLTTIDYEDKLDNLTVKIKYVYDEKGVLRLASVQNILGDIVVYESVMELQMTLMDKIMEDYLVVIIIGGVALIGIVVIVTVIIKKRKA